MTKQTIKENVRRNTWLDRVFMGVGAAVICGFATREAMRHIRAGDFRLQIALAVMFVGFMGYLVIAPIFRNR